MPVRSYQADAFLQSEGPARLLWNRHTTDENIWFSGDSGYADHFKDIGDRHGPFDLWMMECGQYCEDWPQIHMFPAESVQVAIDAGVSVANPVHWAGFKLSYQHAWYEPVEEFVRYAGDKMLTSLTPEIGEVFDPSSASTRWWETYK